MLPVQVLRAQTDETVTLHCYVPFATLPGLPVTWMFAKDVSCIYACARVYIDIQERTGPG